MATSHLSICAARAGHTSDHWAKPKARGGISTPAPCGRRPRPNSIPKTCGSSPGNGTAPALTCSPRSAATPGWRTAARPIATAQCWRYAMAPPAACSPGPGSLPAGRSDHVVGKAGRNHRAWDYPQYPPRHRGRDRRRAVDRTRHWPSLVRRQPARKLYRCERARAARRLTSGGARDMPGPLG